jgi:hypothetical protein
VSFLFLKNILKNFVKLNVSRVTGFPEFPNIGLSSRVAEWEMMAMGWPLSRSDQH